MYRVTVDVGGTFTDCLVLDEDSGDLRQFKAPTTPADPSLGLIDAVTKAATHYEHTLDEFLGRVELLIHGTTLATNTLINEDGALTGMITTKHFRDMLEIRRGHKNVRTSMYNVFVPPYKPLIPRHLRAVAEERVVYTGEVITPLNEDEVRESAEKLKEKGVESVAIGFLHSYANPSHELRAAEIAREVLGDDVYVTTSAEILPVWREWERFSTTAVSASREAPRRERLRREPAPHAFRRPRRDGRELYSAGRLSDRLRAGGGPRGGGAPGLEQWPCQPPQLRHGRHLDRHRRRHER
jgi:N-methylhydantoinase A